MSHQDHETLLSGDNVVFIEDLYASYLRDPSSVDAAWKEFFAAQFDPADVPQGEPDFGVRSIFSGVTTSLSVNDTSFSELANGAQHTTVDAPNKTSEFAGKVLALMNAYRLHGHLVAKIDPLERPRGFSGVELRPETYGIEKGDYETPVVAKALFDDERVPLKRVLDRLNELYCSHIGVEYQHVHDPDAREWLRQRIEKDNYAPINGAAEKTRILEGLIQSDSFEEFLQRKYVGVKRFSISGGDAVIPMLQSILEEAANTGTVESLLAMAHRGRLSVLRNILGKSAFSMLSEFEKPPNPEDLFGRLDVKYHMGYSTEYTTFSGKNVHLSLAFNPSHLEFANAVVLGRSRAKLLRKAASFDNLSSIQNQLLPILIHGDASFAGQGIVTETLNMSQLDGYTVGGSIHLVINNQIGFTAIPTESRSTTYATDVAKMLDVPIFHVNGYDPEACVRVAKLALQYRQKFKKDVVIDLVCIRRYGHNEGDEPRFTQPTMYHLIDKLGVEHKEYSKQLIAEGILTEADVEALWNKHYQPYETAFDEAKEKPEGPSVSTGKGLWGDYKGGELGVADEVTTSVPLDNLLSIGNVITTIPDNVTPHRTVKRLYETRAKMLAGEHDLDWGFAEALAFASLVQEGHPVRLTGQDCIRATFGQRHAAIFDNNTGERYWPTRQIEGGALFEVHNSLLSESAVLGYEHGYSLDTPDGLTLWEAQFGDFANGAQVMIDQFVCSSEDKWERLSGLVMLLPHGFEGQGPEHSSGRLERYLQLSAQDNMYVCNLTTPANYFHALRRQLHSPFRKPLIVMTPKSLLRLRDAGSKLEELAEGSFQKVIDDSRDLSSVKRVVFCSGKVYYDLRANAEEHNRDDVAIVRVEQLYPFSKDKIQAILDRYQTKDVVWAQEEPKNMGAWSYILEQFYEAFGSDFIPTYSGRAASSSPATGFKAAHDLEQAKLVKETFELS